MSRRPFPSTAIPRHGSLIQHATTPDRGNPSRRWRGNEEPAIDDLLADPILHLLIGRDGLTLADVQATVDAARRHLRGRRVRMAA